LLTAHCLLLTVYGPPSSLLDVLPTFLVIGAAKAGTTSLYDYLGQHPDVFVTAVKEPRFFAYDGRPVPRGGPGLDWIHDATVTDAAVYEALYDEAGSARARGEASPVYLYSAHAAARIAARVPAAKLVAVLRDPADRAFSHYLHLRRDRLEPCASFSDALAREKQRIADDWDWSFHYRALGFYDSQLTRYATLFPAGSLHVELYEDLESDAAGVVRRVYEFLGVDVGFEPDVRARLNTGGVPREGASWRVANRYDHPIRRVLRPMIPHRMRLMMLARLRRRALSRPVMEPAIRRDLVEGYREEILRLQTRLGRDLSSWLRTDP
jgi:hypothetical protein